MTAAVAAAGASLLDWDQLPGAAGGSLEFAEVPFGHPLWVLYSSGTTGLPKAIMHGHGGVVLEHLKALSLHQDLGPGSVFFWYTTTGWMMWNYLAGGLLVGATVLLYDGSATYPGTDALWRLAARTGVTYFGTGAPYLLACAKAELSPGRELDLSAVRGIGSTGSPLPPEGFDWVYRAVGADLLLGSFSGGTDLCTGFVGPSPLLPVRAGIIAGRCLGARVEAFDESGQAGHRAGRRAGHHRADAVDAGRLLERSRRGALPRQLLRRLSGSMAARGLDHHAAGRRLRDLRALGRHAEPGRGADGHQRVLPGGGAAAGDHRQPGGGYRAARHAPGGWCCTWCWPRAARLDDELTGRIRGALRSELSPRHVPDEIHQVPGVPRTLSGKKLEVPVRKILLGTPVAQAADPDALANPEVLALFASHADPAYSQDEVQRGKKGD